MLGLNVDWQRSCLERGCPDPFPPPRGLLTSVTSTTLSPASGHEAWSPKGPTASSSSGHRTTTASEPHQATSSGTESALVSNSEICFVKSETTGAGEGVSRGERGGVGGVCYLMGGCGVKKPQRLSRPPSSQSTC